MGHRWRTGVGKGTVEASGDIVGHRTSDNAHAGKMRGERCLRWSNGATRQPTVKQKLEANEVVFISVTFNEMREHESSSVLTTTFTFT